MTEEVEIDVPTKRLKATNRTSSNGAEHHRDDTRLSEYRKTLERYDKGPLNAYTDVLPNEVKRCLRWVGDSERTQAEAKGFEPVRFSDYTQTANLKEAGQVSRGRDDETINEGGLTLMVQPEEYKRIYIERETEKGVRQMKSIKQHQSFRPVGRTDQVPYVFADSKSEYRAFNERDSG